MKVLHAKIHAERIELIEQRARKRQVEIDELKRIISKKNEEHCEGK